jgi:hypothetical protein
MIWIISERASLKAPSIPLPVILPCCLKLDLSQSSLDAFRPLSDALNALPGPLQSHLQTLLLQRPHVLRIRGGPAYRPRRAPLTQERVWIGAKMRIGARLARALAGI